MVALSIIRVCGLVYGDSIDSVWQTYWQFLGSEIGLFLASAVAFRAFFMARTKSSNAVPYSLKRVLKNTLSGPNRRRLSDTLQDSWSRMPESELGSLSQVDHTGPDTRHGIGASGLSGDNLETNLLSHPANILLPACRNGSGSRNSGQLGSISYLKTPNDYL
jgi:hypothetical protein